MNGLRPLIPRSLAYLSRHDWTWPIIRAFADNRRQNVRWPDTTQGRMRWIEFGNALFDTIGGRRPTPQESQAQFAAIYKALQASGAAV